MTSKREGLIKIKKVITIIALVAFVFVAGFSIYYIGESNKEKEAAKEDALTIKVNLAQEEFTQGEEMAFLIEVKNNNLKDFEKTYDPSCEYVWIMELQKEGKVIEQGHGDCLKTQKEVLKMEPSESLKYILNKQIDEPGTYQAIFRTFGEELKKEFTIKEKPKTKDGEE